MQNLKLVILDRDGTINYDRDDYVKSPEEWQPMPHASNLTISTKVLWLWPCH